MKKVSFKRDKYRESRGGYSRFLNVYCHHCGTKILTYQKDGPGELKRMYLDRIIAPNKLVKLQNLSIKNIPNLICPKCKYIIAIPYVYSKEKRNALRLFTGAITKKVTKISN
jgi:ribosomal protein L32